MKTTKGRERYAKRGRVIDATAAEPPPMETAAAASTERNPVTRGDAVR